MQVKKYLIPDCSIFKIQMPKNSKILSCQNMSFWALVDGSEKMEERIFKLIENGEEIDDSITQGYVCSMEFNSKDYHLFEVK